MMLRTVLRMVVMTRIMLTIIVVNMLINAVSIYVLMMIVMEDIGSAKLFYVGG